jgi:hypothetical protein
MAFIVYHFLGNMDDEEDLKDALSKVLAEKSKEELGKLVDAATTLGWGGDCRERKSVFVPLISELAIRDIKKLEAEAEARSDEVGGLSGKISPQNQIRQKLVNDFTKAEVEQMLQAAVFFKWPAERKLPLVMAKQELDEKAVAEATLASMNYYELL